MLIPRLISRNIFEDPRGYFSEIFNKKYLDELGITDNFVQCNYVNSNKNSLRGLHYQERPMQQAKLLTVLHGNILDVSVHIRDGSVFVFRIKEGESIYIPDNYAHGFLSLEDSKVAYFCSNFYSPEHARGFIWNDEALNIDWGIADPILSDRDKKWGRFEVKK